MNNTIALGILAIMISIVLILITVGFDKRITKLEIEHKKIL